MLLKMLQQQFLLKSFYSKSYCDTVTKRSTEKVFFFRIDKKFFILTDKFLTRMSRQLMVDRDSFLNEKEKEIFFDLKNKFSISNDINFDRFHRNFIEAAVDDRKTKWMLIIENRNYEKKIQPF